MAEWGMFPGSILRSPGNGQVEGRGTKLFNTALGRKQEAKRLKEAHESHLAAACVGLMMGFDQVWSLLPVSMWIRLAWATKYMLGIFDPQSQ